ncbi:sensor histidine kinase [Exiguobacterium sp. SH1S4]|nr:sensor histidine kinase [Exiguobacterium sp. SH4S7]TCI48061.1 sensor histidine kinase [Exiguobacterium sp. SH5S32]TCI54945.1 sensor histidine kinase [Exiguobacterium sp. SH1S4]TCI62956.1 sensor histidine kinase [Exiguobacterium sp. SH0S2]TCI74740.1 sensor histidine kinase [Exiguobacterium sp. SH1S1]
MVNHITDRTALEHIITNMIDTVTESKEEIVRITENSANEYSSIQTELKELTQKIEFHIKESERLDLLVKAAKNKLVQVSKKFHIHSEQEIREAYELANQMQLERFLIQKEEMVSQQRRNDLERRLLVLQDTMERADRLVSRVSVVLNFLRDDLQQEYSDMMKKQEMAISVFEAAERERRHLAREMHDGPAQSLAHILIRADLIEKTFDRRGKDEAFAELHELKRLIRGALVDVRRLIYDLRPMSLDDLGFLPTLERYLHQTEEYTAIKTRLNYRGNRTRLSEKLEINVFRLVQEAVQNAIKHSKTTEIIVNVEQALDVIHIHVRDHGVGFVPSMIGQESFGIVGMRERIELVNGSINIDSEIGKGTVVRMSIPIL